MTEAERLARAAIERTLAACTQAGDARKAEAYAACFSEDGVLALDPPIVGREEIRRWVSGATLFAAPGGGNPGFVSHHLTTCRIELTSDRTAIVRTYWLVTSAAGLDHNGYYDDRFVAVGEAWLIAHRRPRTLWASPHSVIVGEVKF